MTSPPSPPCWARWLLHQFCAPTQLEDIEGDLAEQFITQRQRDGALRAHLTYWVDVLRFIATPHVRHTHRPTYDQARNPLMLKNYLTIAFRTLRRNKGYTFINVMGLAVGIACCLLILLFIHNEWRYDRFHENADRIYRVVTTLQPDSENEGGHPMALSSRFVADYVRQDYPEVSEQVRLKKWNPQLRHEGTYYDQDNFLFADSSFFDIFSFPLLEGNPATALQEPYTLVVTESIQQKYFGNTSALGQTLVLNDSLTFTITGITADPPAYSHVTFDALASYTTAESLYPPRSFDWVNFGNNYTYLLLHESASPDALEAKLHDLPMEQFGEALKQVGFVSSLSIEPLQSIYLYSEADAAIGPVGNLTVLYIFGGIALFVLLIACINFMNLSTARSMERAREVGIRKLLGSQRGTLILQFVGESMTIVMTALGVAVILLALALPSFNALADKELTFSTLLMPEAILLVFLFAGGVGLLAGSYPALVLSRFQPVAVLKGAFKTSRHGAYLRKSLVVFQFTISIALISITLIVLQQLRYMQNQRLGFDKEQVLVLDIPADELAQRSEVLADAFKMVPSVVSVSSSNTVPGQRIGESIIYPNASAKEDIKGFKLLTTDHGYLNTMDVDLVAGRNFAQAMTSDAQDAALINETAVSELGYASPDSALGRVLVEASDMRPLTIVGVISDYHHVALQERIAPMMLRIKPDWYGYLSLRLSTEDLSTAMQQIETTWERLFPGYPFDFFFLDDTFDRQYADEQRLIQIFGTFAGLAILIACLGLIGLASFLAIQRTKEIGIRKVLGATVPQIMILLIREFVLPILIAFVIAAPLAYLAMQRWLEDFAYHTELGIGVFVLAGGLALLVSVLMISYQSIKVAVADPVTSLRHE